MTVEDVHIGMGSVLASADFFYCSWSRRQKEISLSLIPFLKVTELDRQHRQHFNSHRDGNAQIRPEKLLVAIDF